MAEDNKNCLNTLQSSNEGVAYRQIGEMNHQFLGEVCYLIRNYEGDLPNLREIFQPEAIDWILKESVDQYYISIIDFVIETGYKDEPEIDVDGKTILRRCTPIHNALENDIAFIIPELFQIYDRFDLNYADEGGMTHFHLACQFGCVDEVKKFLEAGQNPYCIAEKTGDSPLHFALANEHKNVAELLLRNGADPNLADEDGWTPLHVICLMDRGAELLPIDSSRSTKKLTRW
uniref:Ankyrin repeat protein n=1 Tax=Trichogramma kaykai TaxID=54128 RepID=A0ABD2XDB8_9HYME